MLSHILLMNMKYINVKPSNSEGIVFASGSKNIALPLICASLITRSKVKLNNVPDILDVRNLLDILNDLNVKTKFVNNTLLIDSSNLIYKDFSFSKIKKLRASYYLLGALIPSNKKIIFTYPGGCNFQARPIDLHLYAFSCLNIQIEEKDDLLVFTHNDLHSGRIEFSKKSVGATINALLSSCQINGKTIIRNPCFDYEVIQVCDFLNRIGGSVIINQSINQIIVEGKKQFAIDEYLVKPDRIEVGTYALLGINKGKTLIINVDISPLNALLKLFDYLKINYSYGDNYLLVNKSNINKDVKLILNTDPYLHTDLGPLLCAFLLKNSKISIIKDLVYPKRNSYIEELNKMGAKIKVINDQIIIFPHSIFNTSVTSGKDLRGTMSLLLCAIFSNMEQQITDYNYLLRGYDNLFEKLKNLNIRIEEIEK